MRISDWSSDVCSSDLHHLGGGLEPDAAALAQRIGGAALPVHGVRLVDLTEPSRKDSLMTAEREFTTGRRSTAPRTASDTAAHMPRPPPAAQDRKSTRLNSSH